MYGGDCDAAIAEAAAAVTHVQSQGQEVGSGDEGLGLLCFDFSSAETVSSQISKIEFLAPRFSSQGKFVGEKNVCPK